MSTLLEVTDVKQVFRTGFWMRPVEVLRNINFTLPEKTIFGFLGANGAGKTTLIHLMTGLRRPTEGSVRVCGFPAHSIEARSRIGYLPERPYFQEHLTGESLLQYFGSLAGMPRSKVNGRIPTVLKQVGLSDARKRELKRYSKGMLQRIGIAQALIHDPEFLILDEPMSGLDPIGRKDIRELILKLSQEGRTIFFSSHVIPDVEAICDQVGLIQKGKLLGCGPIGQFLAKGPLQTEIAFSDVDPEKVRKISELDGVREMPDGMKGVVSSQASVSAVLKKLLENRATILWVTPIRPSLEDLFAKGDS